jgi:hypothetical protein
MNLRTLQAIAFALGCILALESATPAFAQSIATGGDPDSQQPIASVPPVISTPANHASDVVTSGGNPETSSYPQAPGSQPQDTQTQDIRELLRVQQTQEAARKQNPDPDAVLHQPQGAAAARLQPTTGTPASQPAGAAIAPAKQKRSRSFLIGMGILAATGLALGTVVALSGASPSTPPGSK